MNSNGTPKNLRQPWVKGEPSPNPSGRPKRLPISDTYALFAKEPIPESLRRALRRTGVVLQPGATFADAVGQQMWKKAIFGDLNAVKEIRESVEGKAAQRPADPGDKEPVQIHVVYDVERKGDSVTPDLQPELVPDKNESHE